MFPNKKTCRDETSLKPQSTHHPNSRIVHIVVKLGPMIPQTSEGEARSHMTAVFLFQCYDSILRLKFAHSVACLGNNVSVNLSLLISPGCRIYASVNWVSIGSDNDLSPGRHQAIIWTNAVESVKTRSI